VSGLELELDQDRVQVSLNVEVWCNNRHGRESGGCEGDRRVCRMENIRGNYLGANVWWRRLFGIPFKVLLYDDLEGVVSSVTLQRWRLHHSICHSQKPPAICILCGYIFCTTGVIPDWSFTLGE